MASPFHDTILKGKVALITGGGTGIGLEIGAMLARHGANVAVMGRRRHVLDAAVKILEREGAKAVGLEGDVRKKEDAVRVVELTVKLFGRLDILVNNAAGNFLVPAENLSPNGFHTVLDIDTVGTFTMCVASLEYLKRGGLGKTASEDGIIVNISATLHYSASWYQIHASAAKAAVDSLTRSFALEWGTDYGIRVNGIAPGPIEDTVGMSRIVPDEARNVHTNEIPVGEKRDVALAVVFLVSDAAKHINGATITVDGGAWLRKPRWATKETIQSISRVVEKRSRSTDMVPQSKI